jgi:hypothetical protein
MTSKSLKPIKILVACPNDVENIRDYIKKHCIELNKALAEDEQLELCIIDWRSNVRGKITGDPPQKIINEEFDKIEYDFFIGIFWKRFGDKQKNGLTPTEEEFERAFNGYKKFGYPLLVKIYFLEEPFYPKDTYESYQMTEVMNFKERMKEIGLYTPISEKEFNFFMPGELLSIVSEFKKPLPVLRVRKIKTNYLNKYHIKRYLVRVRDQEKIDSLKLIEQIKYIVILGDAGCGKTQEINFLTDYYSNKENTLFPIRIQLRNYTNQEIEIFIPEEYKEIGDPNIIFLLDGFDEVESKNKLTLIRSIQYYKEKHPETKFIVTSRTNFYHSDLDGFHEYYLADLESLDIQNYIENV